ncbi:phage tail tube protein [Zestomonas carbonaria]|uniref:Virion structural protein n=1 Tax=Zestomonas carbonaria TaxID=2762745 RepID=A0A7U7ELK2_9GAMM|nr:hypothetical protein [Pseudomonas carbonaria]CAD5107237.1 hypothetical protein PSEWESI4_01508 [Pseudomonas carbonaria]
MSLFSFQGKVWLAERSAQGKPLKKTWLGNVPSLTLQLATETSNKIESFSGNRLQYGLLQRGKTATLNMTLDEWTAYNIALALYAQQVAIPTSTVTGEALPTPLAVGDVIRLAKPFISDLVLTQAPSTVLVAGTDYRIESASAGLIEFLTAPSAAVTAAYENEAAEAVTMFTQTPPERWLLLDGINTETQEEVLLDLYRCKFNPVSDFGLIHDEYGSLPLTGSVLFDPLNAATANLGGYGRVVQKAA